VELADVRGARALDVGCGTGRVARTLLELGAREVVGIDRARAMLDVAARSLGERVRLIEGDARAIDLDAIGGEGSFDLATAGWCFGHFRKWMPEGWQDDVGRALDGMERAVAPGGALVVIETLGTGRTEPRHDASLEEYFALLESRGYERRWIRTDYAFASADEAAEVLGAFFGEALIARIRAESLTRVPECTGLWHRVR
jgi:ubiquinone/menaquinone biosynthesis C-methylase UbiE